MEVFIADLVIDVKGLRCPRPLLTAKQTLEKMQPGQTLEVISTDSTAKSSFPPFLTRTGDVLLNIRTEGEEIRLYIKKK